MKPARAQRVGRQILQEVSMIVECELKDPRLEFVTFTEVRMSPDLRVARVYFTCLDPERSLERCRAGLSQATRYLRRELGRRLRLRYVPELRFEFDDSIDRADRIARLIASARGPEEDGG